MKDYKLKQRNLRASHTLGFVFHFRHALKVGENKQKKTDRFPCLVRTEAVGMAE
jgi:hypothetical protein